MGDTGSCKFFIDDVTFPDGTVVMIERSSSGSLEVLCRGSVIYPFVPLCPRRPREWNRGSPTHVVKVFLFDSCSYSSTDWSSQGVVNPCSYLSVKRSSLHSFGSPSRVGQEE